MHGGFVYRTQLTNIDVLELQLRLQVPLTDLWFHTTAQPQNEVCYHYLRMGKQGPQWNTAEEINPGSPRHLPETMTILP